MNTPSPVAPFFQPLGASRKGPRKGDIFVMRISDSTYLFGRVVSTTPRIGPFNDLVLLYVFRTRTESPTLPSRAVLRTDNLLTPPMISDRSPWRRGYFQTVDNMPFQKGEFLSQHCFRRVINGKYYDESENELLTASPPVGVFGVINLGGIENEIAKALGVTVPSRKTAPPSMRRRIPKGGRIRILYRNTEELERLLTLEDLFLDDGVLWDAGYSSETPGRIWQLEAKKGSISPEELIRKLKAAGLSHEVEESR